MKEEIIEKSKEWVKKAERDLQVARILFEKEVYDYSLFHSQQAIEKFLKAFLTLHNKPFGKTHNIKKLTKLCMEIDKEFNYLEKMGTGELYRFEKAEDIKVSIHMFADLTENSARRISSKQELDL